MEQSFNTQGINLQPGATQTNGTRFWDLRHSWFTYRWSQKLQMIQERKGIKTFFLQKHKNQHLLLKKQGKWNVLFEIISEKKINFKVAFNLLIRASNFLIRASLVAQSVGKKSACNAGNPGLIPGLGRSPGAGNGCPYQYFVWEIPWREEPGGLQSGPKWQTWLTTKPPPLIF